MLPQDGLSPCETHRGRDGYRFAQPILRSYRPMSWLAFAFSGPLLWALSTHLDKYLVEQYFKTSDVAVLLVFTALVGLITLPFIAYFQPAAAAPGLGAATLMGLSGLLYMTGMLFYLNALQSEE